MYTSVQTWVEQDTPIEARNTLSYSVLKLGNAPANVAIFLGRSPEEVLVNIQRLQDALADLKWRINTE